MAGFHSKAQKSMKIVFILANSADPDEMPPYAAFHLGLYCLPNYLFTGVQNEKGITKMQQRINQFLPSWMHVFLYCWFVYKTSFVHFSKFYRRDKKLS